MSDNSLAYCQALTSGPSALANFGLFLTTPSCWGWGIPNALVYGDFPPPPQPTPPPAVVNPQQADLGQSAIDASLAAGAAANQQTYQNFFGSVADTSSGNNLAVIAIVVAVLAGLLVAGKAIR